jgi:hypothetical protein
MFFTESMSVGTIPCKHAVQVGASCMRLVIIKNTIVFYLAFRKNWALGIEVVADGGG